ncbi:MAG: hypothetical protein WCL44_15145 [bacterium]
MGLPRGCKVARLKELSPCAISWPIDTTNMFSWLSIHREAIHRILEYRQNEKELLTILREMEQQGLKVISLQDEGADGQTIPLAEIDPFTFLASFNRRVTDKNRKENWSFLKARWGLKAPVPDDFTGIPVLHNMTSRLFPHAGEREKDHVGHLWHVAALASDGGIEKVDEESLNRCLKLKCVGIRRLTIVLFWINLEGEYADTCEMMLLYPTVDSPLSATFTHKGHTISIRTINLDQPWPSIRKDLLALIA